MRELLRLLGSLKLAVVLIVVLATVLAVATFVEAAKGREYTQWYVYHQSWFCTLLGLLAANVLAAMLLRFPWRKSQAGFLITHVGLLVLLAGAIETFLGGIEGQLSLEEGETSDRIVLHDCSRFKVQWLKQHGGTGQPSAIFAFQPGPVDWPEGKTLELGSLDGVELEVIRFLAHARSNEDWIADQSPAGIPALKLAYTGPDSTASAETWMIAGQFGAEVAAGSARIAFQQAGMESQVEDFLRPPAKDMDPSGVLSIHYDNHMTRIPVSKNAGKKVPLPGNVSVELAEYLPNAKPNTDGRFTSEGKEPKNPLLELRVYLPGKKEPLRQIAFARMPFLNLDGVHGRTYPVKFWYHHPAAAPETGIEFLASPGGKLYSRTIAGGKCEPRGEVRAGDTLNAWGHAKVAIVKFLPHARQEISFQPVDAGPEDAEPQAAAEIELRAKDVTRRLWLARGEGNATPQTVSTADGPLRISFGYDDFRLGFAIRLKKFTQGMNPGGMGAASFASAVQLVDAGGGVRQEQEISMNHPLVHNKFAFYQSSVTPDGNGSVLTVAYDPGRIAKYLGSLMICLGTLVIFIKKADWFNRTASAPRDQTPESKSRSTSCEVLS
jgi:hypothetical protein